MCHMLKMKRYYHPFVVIGLLVFMRVPLLAEPSAALLDQLNSDQFDERNKAYVELMKWAQGNLESSPEQLHKIWRESKQPEVRSRCYEMMKSVAIQRRFGKAGIGRY